MLEKLQQQVGSRNQGSDYEAPRRRRSGSDHPHLNWFEWFMLGMALVGALGGWLEGKLLLALPPLALAALLTVQALGVKQG
jgi:hypothetical protein